MVLARSLLTASKVLEMCSAVSNVLGAQCCQSGYGKGIRQGWSVLVVPHHVLSLVCVSLTPQDFCPEDPEGGKAIGRLIQTPTHCLPCQRPPAGGKWGEGLLKLCL